MEESESAPWRGWNYDALLMLNKNYLENKVCDSNLWILQQYTGFSNAYNISNIIWADKNFTWIVGRKKKCS